MVNIDTSGFIDSTGYHYINEVFNKTVVLNNTVVEYKGWFNAFPYEQFFILFLIPVICMIILFIILKNWNQIKDYIKKIQSNYGYILILMLGNNKRIKEVMVKLDEYNSFMFKKKKYSLESMSHFIIGYRNNIPVFFYQENFILPLVIEKSKINETIRKAYKNVKLTDNEVNAIGIKFDPQILELVYRKKLIQDLYASVKDTGNSTFIMWALIIFGGILVLYFTGLLEPLLAQIGIHLPNNTGNVTNAINTTIVK
jgi:hypothetical protein